MLGEISGHSSTHNRVWLSCSDGRGVGLFRLLCLANHNQEDRPRSRANENHNHKANRPITPVRPRHDTITDESEYCFEVKRRR